jgi:hypothetical protein
MSSNARLGAAGGIVFAILTFVAFVIVIPKPPDMDDPAAVFAAFYSDHQDALRAGFTMVGIGLFFFIWFLGSLRAALAAAEGGSERLASIAYGAGLIGAAVLMLGLTAALTAAFRPDEIDPEITRGFNDFFAVSAAPAASALVAFFAAIALAGFRHGALPGWTAWTSAVAAVGQIPAIGAALTTTGAFAGDGVLGLFVPVLTFLVGLVAISVALMRNPEPSAVTT